MPQPLTDLVEQFCNFQRKQRGKTDGGVQTYRWILEQFVLFVRHRHGRLARVTDLTPAMIQAWMDEMAAADLALSTMRVRQSVVSSFCAWLVKREVLAANPVAKLERPPHHREPPTQVPVSSIMDALVQAAKRRRRPRAVAVFLILRFTAMRRESVVTLQVHHLDGTWGLRGVRVKGGKTRDIPVPSAVMTFLHAYVERVLSKEVGADRTGDAALLVHLGAAHRRHDAGAHDREKHLALLQDLRADDWLPGAQAPRPASRRGDGGLGAAPRPRGGPRVARPRPHRHDAGLHEHQAAAAQACGGVL